MWTFRLFRILSASLQGNYVNFRYDRQIIETLPSILFKDFLGRSLMIGWREKILKPWKSAHSSHSVCLCVCVSVCKQDTGHTFWPRNLIFGLSDPWDMRKNRIFLFFKIFIFTLFIFSLYNTSNFFVSSYWSQFFT